MNESEGVADTMRSPTGAQNVHYPQVRRRAARGAFRLEVLGTAFSKIGSAGPSICGKAV